MSNWETAVGEKYWDDSLFHMESLLSVTGVEGGPDEPPKFKSYLGIPGLPLPQRVPLRIGPVSSAFLGDEPAEAGSARRAGLGTLCYYGYGLSRIDVGPIRGWPYHRLVPSARCFYPTELYVCASAMDVSPGVYHYDPLHHALVPLRAGDHLPVVSDALGTDLTGAAGAVVLTSHLWKTAFRYRHYAYRLCTQEAGLVAGNVLMVATALGLRGRVHYRFLDEALDRLLGLSFDEERTMAVLPLYPAGATAGHAAGASPGAHEVAATLAPLHMPYRDVTKDRSLAGRAYDMASNSVLTDIGNVTWQGTGAAPPLESSASGRRAAFAGIGRQAVDLAAALRTRHSGGTLFRPVPGPVPLSSVTTLADWAPWPYDSDIGTTPVSRLYLLAQHVAELDSAVYRCDADGLHRTAPFPPGRLDQQVGFSPPVADLSTANVVCYIVADRALAGGWGNRGYRIASMDAGVIAQRVNVLAAAAGLAARPVNGYKARLVQRLLGIEDHQVPLFQIIVGRKPATAQYEMPVVF